MALFDGIQKIAFSSVQCVFGDLLLWMPSNNPIQQTAKVLYNSPSTKYVVPQSREELGDADRYGYNPYKYFFEYYNDQLIGLKASVDAGGVEVVTVNGITLCVIEVGSKNDGKTCVAYCNEWIDE